ncbi:MAG: hypothetical protein HY962_06645 [Ignavibacteriae bacterium]|nr:hypothetical protein [Ignavibacteriota bacterium]
MAAVFLCGMLCVPRADAAPAADSLEYAAFAVRLRAVFTEEQARAIISKLPPKCKVYGYDIGDISSDSLPDVVLSYKADDAPRRELGVAILLAEGKDFRPVRTLARTYISEPIEVGFSIDEGVCHITRKRGEYNWEITGYTARGGVFRQADYWETSRVRSGGASVGFEQHTDFRTHRSSESYYRVSDGKVLLKHEATALPVYPVGTKISSDDAIPIADTTYRSLVKGSSSWSGPDDCALFSSAVYDTSHLYLTFRVLDDRLLSGADPEHSDRMVLCFDPSLQKKLEGTGKTRVPDENTLLRITVLLGDGAKMPPVVMVSAPAEKEKDSRRPVSRLVKAKVEKESGGVYMVTCTVPRQMFPRDAISIPFSAGYYDIDMPEHPEWVTVAATSDDFDPARPATYGRLYLLEAGAVPFERENLNVRSLLARMQRAGVVGG